MKWNTAISTRVNNELFIRGIAHSKLIQEHTFTEVSFFLLSGRLPDQSEQKLFDILLASCVEHGIEAPSDFVPRVSASVGNSLHVAAAAGLLAIGDWHGGAAEELARLLYSKADAATIVKNVLAAQKRVPGFGHALYKDKDPRAEALLQKAEELGVAHAYIKKVRELEHELEAQSGKHLPLNIDGALAACMCELGLDWRLGRALFGFARMPGMLAHALEEVLREKPYRRLDVGDTTYDGPQINH